MKLYTIKTLLATSVLISFQLNAATYYVSPTGTATWPTCTNELSPCNGRTAVENAVAGDIVYFRDGTYDPTLNPVSSWSSTANSLKYERLPWNPSNSGTAANPITFRAYPGEHPVFLDNIYGGAIGAVGRDYIVWDGFSGTIVDAPGQVIYFAYFNGTNGCKFINGDLTGVLKDSHHNSALIYLLNTDNTVIENNRLHGMNDDTSGPGEEAVNASAILNFNSRNMVIKNNDIYNNYLGIWDKDTEQNNKYFQNHIYGGNTTTTRCRTGIQINEQEVYFGSPNNAQAYQNIIRNCDIGISVYEDVLANNNVRIYNNVIYYGSTGVDDYAGINISSDSRNAEIYNNIVDGYAVPLLYFPTLTTTVAFSNFNNFFSDVSMRWRVGTSTNYSTLGLWTSSTTYDANSLTTNPLFINSSSTFPADFRLQNDSLAIGKGRNGENLGAYPASNSPNIGVNTVRPKPPVLN